MARPVAMARPSRPSHNPASAMTNQSAVVSAGQGDRTAKAGAKKKPSPMYHDEPARSDVKTKRSHLGIGGGVTASWRDRIVAPFRAGCGLHRALREVARAITSDVVDRGAIAGQTEARDDGSGANSPLRDA